MLNLSHTTNDTIEKLLEEFEWVKCKKNKEVIEYLNVPCAFDIEVSSFYDKDNNKVGSMYIYVIGINGKTKLGRTWKEFEQDIKSIKQYYKLNIKRRIIIYIHNLHYEFQFIRKRFKWDKVFSIDLRKPVYAVTTDGIEFRCSYILSMLSLKKVGENLIKYKIQKLSGDLDYNKIRGNITPINDKEKQYVINDGLVVMAYIQELIEEYGNINNIPLTGTGFVRKLCKENCIIGKDKWEYRQLVRKLTMTPELYKMLKQSYQGGFTHANGFRVNNDYENVYSFDFTSSYPTSLVAEKYPMDSGYKVHISNMKQLDFYISNFACLFMITFYDLDETFIYDHYISLSKCLEKEGEEVDNGRVVCAKKITIIITDLDYKIIKQTYKWSKAEIINFYIFTKEYLPTDLVKTILQLYKDKTELKDVVGKEVEYNRSKQLLNSCYGMCVTDPAKDESIYEDNNRSKKSKDLISCMESYNKSWSRFLYYARGVWCTAYSRYNLWTGIYNMNGDHIYVDTDSIKVLNFTKHKEYFDNYNKDVINKLYKAIKHHNIDDSYIKPKNKKGIEKMLGIWDFEGIYKHFKTLGAKRYILQKENGDIQITISGVDKAKGAEYLVYKYKTQENIFKHFTDDLKFPGEYLNENINKIENANGKLTHTYIDIERKGTAIDYLGNKFDYDELSCIHMEKCDYSMSISELFKNYLIGIREDFII